MVGEVATVPVEGGLVAFVFLSWSRLDLVLERFMTYLFSAGCQAAHPSPRLTFDQFSVHCGPSRESFDHREMPTGSSRIIQPISYFYLLPVSAPLVGRTSRKWVTAAKPTGPGWVADEGQARRLGITSSSLRKLSRVDDLVADHDQLAILALGHPSQVCEGLVGIDAEFLHQDSLGLPDDGAARHGDAASGSPGARPAQPRSAPLSPGRSRTHSARRGLSSPNTD